MNYEFKLYVEIIQLMEETLHQLICSLSVYPIIYKVYISQAVSRISSTNIIPKSLKVGH